MMVNIENLVGFSDFILKKTFNLKCSYKLGSSGILRTWTDELSMSVIYSGVHDET